MDVRKAFLDYFEAKGHRPVASAPIVPDDASLLFNNAGMVPFKTIFTGEIPTPSNPRATSCQTCLRAGGKHNDLENVGHTARHHTFFEMLGNFSFGDYFKEEAIAYAWEFITKELKLDIDKLWVTVHDNDDEAEEMWKKHISPDRIMRLGDADNFWSMGDTGPCGPCSEIFYDQGKEHFNGPEDKMGGEGDRFLEIWNLVFMQYEVKTKGGERLPLAKPSIDTGMGLERVIAIKEGKLSNYDSSMFMPMIEKVEELTGKTYEYKSGASFRVIADHIRTSVFLLSQDINFSNEGRGYVLRRILRRAVRHGYLLGLRGAFMYKIVDILVAQMKDVYPYLETKAEAVKTQVQLEEERFFKTIASGIELFNAELKNTKDTFSGEVAFKLYDTFGFPLDLTEDMLKGEKLGLDSSKFDELMLEQRTRAKAAWKGSGDAANEGDFKALLEKFGKNEFEGYTGTANEAKVQALLSEDFKIIDELHSNQKGWVLLDRTPFYAESGGQIGDIGLLDNRGKITDTRKFFDLNLSHVEVKETLKTNDTVKAVVDINRQEVEKHHSATHLLHAALYNILGDHISQAGSSNDARRLRFDFSHPKAMSTSEVAEVEETVNHQILRGIAGLTTEMSIDEAKNSGAKAQFGEKYGDKVRVVSFGDATTELCGGTHVDNTAVIGTFAIVKESGVSAGVRRIEAVCGNAAYNLLKEQRHILRQAAEEVKNKDVLLGVNKLKEQIKTLKSDVQEAMAVSKEDLGSVSINGVTVIIEEIKSGDVKTRIDELKNENDSLCAMLFQIKGDKVMIAAGVKEAGAKAGDWIKKIAPILGGGGGGRPDFAQAGGKDPSKLEEAKTASLEYIRSELS
ncbi:MAG TPA: alanine--tRNA ligase [Sulfurimonas sp.]|nr:alanine--tRNA ligase [Sulfurimonas sp.]